MSDPVKQGPDKEFWNERYKKESFVYGEAPNTFLKNSLSNMEPGRALFVAAGEGRNAVYAATLGWTVHAIDFSLSAKQKAEQLAQKADVKIDYQVVDASTYETAERFDLITFIFFHIPTKDRKRIYQSYFALLKPGAKVVYEAYTPEQLGRSSGGPKSLSMLVDVNEVNSIFEPLQIVELSAGEVTLDEGLYHQGKAMTCRVLAQKV